MENTAQTAPDNSLFDDISSNTDEKEGLNFDFSQGPESFTDEKDDFFSDFEDDFSGFETDDGSKKEEKARSGMHEAAARQYVQTFQIAISRLGMQYAGSSSPDKYKLSEKEEQEYEAVTAAFFESIEWQPSPKAMFIGATLMLSLGVMAKAYSDRQENKAAKNYMKAKQKWENASSQAEAEAAAEEVKHFEQAASNQTQRGNFNLDDKGFYIFDVDNQYIKQKDRTEKPTKMVLDLIQKYKYDENGAKRKNSEINADIRAEIR